MVGSALAALAQDDIKRVLAYSTIGQLAYMAGALAVADRGAAVFHLLTHGAFKALLFLAAGVVIHAAGTNSLAAMARMGGLTKIAPDAYWTMTIGLLALAAFPPFSGFFSKEAVLGAAEHAAFGDAHGARRRPPPPAGSCSSPACSAPCSPRRTRRGCGCSPSAARARAPPPRSTAASPP